MVNDGNTSADVSEILGTSITWSWVEEKLKCKLQTKSCFGNGKKAIRIGIGQGFASIIGRLYLDWVPEDENLPQTVIIKIPSIESTKQLLEGLNSTRMLEEATSNDSEDLLVKFTSVLQQCHNTEVSFYELLSSNGLHIKAPKAYVLQKFTKDCDQGVIVLSDQGDDVVVLMLFNNVTPDEIMQVFDSLAELHAYSLAHPECFDAVSPSSLSDLYQMHDQSKISRAMIKAIGNLDEEKLTTLTEQVNNCLDEIFDVEIIGRLHKEMGMKPVLVHGDLWSGNVIWRKDGERNKLVAIVDWQLVHPGTPCEDIARMMSSSLSAKDRRQQLDAILERYYTKLTEYLHTEPPFTFQQLKDSFIRIYPFAMLTIAPGLGPLVQMQVQSRSDEEQKQLKELMREKAIGLFEDILHYHRLNGLRNNA